MDVHPSDVILLVASAACSVVLAVAVPVLGIATVRGDFRRFARLAGWMLVLVLCGVITATWLGQSAMTYVFVI